MIVQTASQTCPVLKRIPLLITTIQPDQSILRHGMFGSCGFSRGENFVKRPTFYFQNDWSGWPVLTFGKHPKSGQC